MLYIIVVMCITLILLLAYAIFDKYNYKPDNVMEDIYPINGDQEELRKHAQKISSVSSKICTKNCRRKLTRDLKFFYKNIVEDYNFLNKEIKSNRDMVPASRWILDNLYLVEREYNNIRTNMPGKYYRKLPVVDSGYMSGYPRIYYIAVEMLSRTFGKVTEENISTFVNSYQETMELTSGELWCLPIMIKIALIQNISIISRDIVYEQKEKCRAEEVADLIINNYAESDFEEVSKLNSRGIKFTYAFTERLVKVLRDNFMENPHVYKWIDQELEKQNKTFESMIDVDHKRQGNYQISLSNSFSGIREMESINWKKKFEEFSWVENILRKDPAGIYEKMDFPSRDYYRHRIEKLSKNTGISESFIAKKALECSQDALNDRYSGKSVKEYELHIGYYILDNGIQCLRKKLLASGEKDIENFHYNLKLTVKGYIFIILVLTLCSSAAISYMDIYTEYYKTLWKYFITFILMAIPLSEIFISIFNWSINKLSEPRFIPKLEFKFRIPDEYSTIVVIPTLLGSISEIKELIEQMEVYYLANREENLYFAILGDFKDSLYQKEKNDDKLLDTALNMIRKLNSKYFGDGEDKFYFFCRYRSYNQCENKWMGWERKRGKLMEFNRLIRGDDSTTYNVTSGNMSNLKKIKYVITLDCDTNLPKDTAKMLIGAMAHPLNKAYMDRHRVIRGHGILQPRVSVGILNANKTVYSSIFSGDTGVDLYTGAISDVYEDLFDEGIYTGKGIYDLDAFMSVLEDRIPENSVLSHDLLEGSYARTGLVTDIELIDGYPAHYNSSSKRLHRWVRGDWQLLPWMFRKRGLNVLSRWKIFDNLRRSLTSPCIVLLILWSLVVFKNPDKGLVISFITLICPVFFNVSDSVVLPSRGIGLSGRIESFKTSLEQFLLIFVFLPYKAFLMSDAILRTLYRLSISKKNMLQWQASKDSEKNSGKTFLDYIKFMYQGSIISLIIGASAFRNSAFTGSLLLPSCVIWFLSPYIAYKISMDKKSCAVGIDSEDLGFLRKISRRTWSYFEDFVTEENNWLAPDNYQEYPDKGVAYRTSPTNIAMALASNAAAYDFGYITIKKFVYRMDNIISAIENLETYNGNLYNWYDVKSREPLYKYISTVDSGNLVCYIFLMEQTIEEYLKSPIVNKNILMGIKDTMKLADEEIYKDAGVENVYKENEDQLNTVNNNIQFITRIFHDIHDKSSKVIKKYKNFYWNMKLKESTEDYMDFMNEYFGWMDNWFDKGECGIEAVKVEKIICNVALEDLPEHMDTIYESKDSLNKLKNLVIQLKDLKIRLRNLGEAQNFDILYDKPRKLFSIGYDVERNSMDKSHYDLLASEARQASFIAIAKGQVEQSHWFKLGRSMVLSSKEKLLASWSGTMFEYLMPLIIMKPYPNTLLEETYKNLLKVEMHYGKSKHVPWGVSESAYYNFDINSVYQYKAIGVPDIALDRNISHEVVVAPYATIMALQVDKKEALLNLKKLVEVGAEGKYGFYESVDYTPGRVGKKRLQIVKCFMVHHEGMSLMSLDNALQGNVFQKRFHSIPSVKSVELMLQEKVPQSIVYDRRDKIRYADSNLELEDVVPQRKFTTANTNIPEVNIMSNGSYSIMITNSGSGYSRKDGMDIYRWREDPILDHSGMFFYIKNINSNEYWSASYEPCKYHGEQYEVIFSEGKAEFSRKDGNLKTFTEITVSHEDDTETRRISITNSSNYVRNVEITSYMEITMAPYDADLAHPAFSNLFIQTEFIKDPLCLVASRRPRTKNAKKHWVMQTVSVQGKQIGSIQYETNRENFIGRNRDISKPKAMDSDMQLTMTTGSVIDPIISMRVRVGIEPGRTCRIAYTTGISDSRKSVIDLAEKYRNMNNVGRIYDLSVNEANMERKYLGLKASQINVYQSFASRILFLNDNLKERSKYIENISKSQCDLWVYGISGDLPIMLLIVDGERDLSLVRQMIGIHEYLSIKGLKVDLVILNMEQNSYMKSFENHVRELVDTGHLRNSKNKFGGIFIYGRETMPLEDMDFMKAISRIVIDSGKGSILGQMGKNFENEYNDDNTNTLVENNDLNFDYGMDTSKLQYFNGLGGFTNDGTSYIIVLKNYNVTPAPWINVISNKNFGFHVSESGAAYTWNKNSRENKLTSWTNDSVVDGESEALYIKDEDTGKIWSISPEPIRDGGQYIIEHGFGYSIFKHTVHGISGEMVTFVDMHGNVKLCNIKLKNNTDERRNISLNYYAKIVLGVVHEKTSQYITTGFRNEYGYIYGRNPYNRSFGKLICYLKIIGGDNISYTGSREEFIGRGRSHNNPAGLKKEKLSGIVGAGNDSCLAESSKFVLEPNSTKKILVLFGQEDSFADIERTIDKYSRIGMAEIELENTKKFWRDYLGSIQVNTPDKSMDILLNGWLMYQTLSCRYWARSAFYQSGGAYGFRDQLQDVMAIGYLAPSITREHILYSSTRQYLEGDVQHWWHPVVESGIRTRFSDDLLWLPYAVIDYIKNTGDYGILKEKTRYLQDEQLKDGEDERYNISEVSNIEGTVYEHCIRAIERASRFGKHNIPLMGSGDWNDGMSTIGNKGKGESVWLGWFLYNILDEFSKICIEESDIERAEIYRDRKEFIRKNIEKNAWDGSWYRRAYFDDGTPLGSVENDECRIDCIAQAWAVMSKAAKKSRAEEALEALEKNLLKRDQGIILLLTPAFNNSNLEPGYIKGYLPGIRENGGQYTHGAIWAIIAFADMGYNHKALDMFRMLNPISHSSSYLNCRNYKLEPYVIAGDIYYSENNRGRGGWSWYTGAAGWMYRAGMEHILGFKFKGNKGFTIEPCVPEGWKEYSIKYTRQKCIYDIKVSRSHEKGIWMDGSRVENDIVPILEDGVHKVTVNI